MTRVHVAEPARPFTRRPVKARGLVAVLAVILAASPAAVRGQVLSGRVLERETGGAVVGAFIAVYDVNGVPAARGEFSDRSGAFAVRLPRPGLFRVRVEALGFEPLEQDSVLVAGAGTVALELRLQQSPVELDPLEVRAPPLSLQDELSVRGARRRRAESPSAGPSRVFMQGDVEMRSAVEVLDVMRWVAPRSAPCTVWFVNGSKTTFPVNDMPANWFEIIEVYRNPDDVPAAFKTVDSFGCAVIAVWWAPGGRKLSWGRILGLAAAVGLALLMVK